MTDDQFNILLAKLDKQDEKMQEIHVDFSGFRGTITEKVSNLESGAKSEKLWGRIQTVAVIPVVGLLHQIASHYNLIK
jgi:hypothetical protein